MMVRIKTILAAFASGFGLLDGAQKKMAVWLVVASILHAILDLVALGSVMPFISLLVDPELLTRSAKAAAVYAYLGAPDFTVFLSAIGAAAIVLLVLSSAVGMWVQSASNVFAADCQLRLSRELMAAYVAAPYNWISSRNHAVLAQTFQNEVTIWGREFVMRSLMIVKDGAMILLPTWFLITLSPLIGLGALGLLGALGVALMYVIRVRTRSYIADRRRAQDKVAQLASEALAGIKDIKLSGGPQLFAGDFAATYGTVVRNYAHINNWNQSSGVALLLLGQIALISISYAIWLGGEPAGTIAFQIALLVLISSRVVPAVNRVNGALTSLLGLLPWIEKLARMVDQLKALPSDDRAEGKQPVPDWRRIAFEDVSFAYAKSKDVAVHGLDLAFERGRFYGLVGPSGAGKSTAVDLLLGLLVPTSGRIRVDDCDLADIEIAQWRVRIGYVAQSPFLIDGTIRANIAFGVAPAAIDEARLADVVKMAAIEDVVAALPQGLGAPVGDRGLRLSGGQRQRLAIARSLYRNPDILVLDEATSALDTVTENSIQTTLEKLRGKMTVVVIAHRLTTVARCDEIFVMEQGRVRARGSYEALVEGDELFRNMAKDQQRSATE